MFPVLTVTCSFTSGYGGPIDREERPDEVILAAQAKQQQAERPQSQFEQNLEFADDWPVADPFSV